MPRSGMDWPIMVSLILAAGAVVVATDPGSNRECASRTTHTLVVDPRRPRTATSGGGGAGGVVATAGAGASAGTGAGSGSGAFPTLEAALAAARRLPTPRNVTITVVAPLSATTATLRLHRGVVLTAQDSCLRILGGGGGPPCVAALESLCPYRGHRWSRQCNTCAGSQQLALRHAGCSSSQVQEWCAEVTPTPSSSNDHIRMDRVVPPSALRKVGPDNVRVHPAARGHVYRFDLAAVNATHTAPWPDTFTQGDPSTRTLGVFFKGRRLEMARMPKVDEEVSPPRGCPRGCENKGSCKGGIPMRAALAGTSKAWLKHDHKTPSEFAIWPSEVSRVRTWASAIDHGLYLLGNWRVDFVVSGARVDSMDMRDPANATVRFATTVTGGVGWKYDKSESGCGCEPFFAVNALELISQPLEYALDTVDNAIYVFLPPGGEEGELTVVDGAAPLLTISSGAHHVTIESIRAGFSYGGGIMVESGARHTQVRGCTFHDLGGDAVELRARDAALQSNDVFNTGGGGIIVAVNDDNAFETLRPSNVTVVNNHLHHIGYRGIAFGVGISLVNGSTGVRVAHNLVHHVSGKGVHGGHRTSAGAKYANQGQFSNMYEFNEIFQVGLNGSGFAAMYSCCGPVDGAGNIYRYNFIHSSPAVNAVGWDNQLSGQRGYGNVVYFMQNGACGVSSVQCRFQMNRFDWNFPMSRLSLSRH